MDNGASSYRRFLDGDADAFDEIMRAYFDRLVFFIDRYVHDTAAAEDIAIDVFAELVVHKHRYNFKVSLKTYLFMLGRSRALNLLLHRRVIEMVALSEAAAADAAALEEQILQDERRRAVHDALGTLPEDMQTAVHLVYFEELSYAQAAKVMKCSKKRVDNLLYRAKNALRTTLEGAMEE